MTRAAAITPVLRYRDADKAARWLCEAFGFHEHKRAQALDGHVRYVSLRLGDGFVLVRPVGSSGLDDLMTQPEAIGGASTQICYLTVPDAADHRQRAEKAGAKVELEPQDDGLGGRFYTCRDLEGHLWSFGTRSYGVAQEGASAFEPAELSPSLSSAAIALPQGGIASKQGRQSRVLREVGIAAASALLVAGGWLYYATHAGSALRDAASTSAATTARLGDAVKELAGERSRRLLAEGASKEAAAALAEERTVAGQLRQAMHAAQSELADMRKEKDEALLALKSSHELSQTHRLAKDRAEAEVAAAKVRIAEAEAKLAKLASDQPSEERARLAKLEQELLEAKAALLAASKVIDELRGGQLEPMVPDGSPVAEDSPCVLAVQGKVAAGPKGPTTWSSADLRRLCRGAETSLEPGRCFEELMRGKVEWGAGTTWLLSNALALCGGTRNARRTLDCFKRNIQSSQTWRIAIQQCRTK